MATTTAAAGGEDGAGDDFPFAFETSPLVKTTKSSSLTATTNVAGNPPAASLSSSHVSAASSAHSGQHHQQQQQQAYQQQYHQNGNGNRMQQGVGVGNMYRNIHPHYYDAQVVGGPHPPAPFHHAVNHNNNNNMTKVEDTFEKVEGEVEEEEIAFVTVCEPEDNVIIGDVNDNSAGVGAGGNGNGYIPNNVDYKQQQRQHQMQVVDYPKQSKTGFGSSGDVLALLLHESDADAAGGGSSGGNVFVNDCEAAALEARNATSALRSGNLDAAVSHHISAAKLYHSAALRAKKSDASLSRSLLLLSNTQAKSATSLRSVSKSAGKHVAALSRASTTSTSSPSASSSSPSSKKETTESPGNKNNRDISKEGNTMTRQERLRATVRGALDTQREADMTDSTFLGTASNSSSAATAAKKLSSNTADNTKPTAHEKAPATTISNNDAPDKPSHPIDDMMELEREFRDMDMALEMGNSVASLGARAQNSRNSKHQFNEEGSFCLVGPTEKSYMSTTSMWTSPAPPAPPVPTTIHTSKKVGGGGGGGRDKNRVQNMLDASTASHPHPQHHQQQQQQQHPHSSHPQQHPHHPHQLHHPPKQQNDTNGLESSWWGNASAVSQMASSIVSSSSAASSERSRSNSNPHSHHQHQHNAPPPTNTKQLMRLLDSLKTLGDENASLLREVEEAQAARMEAKAAREQMKQFKAEYGKRFAKVKAALEKFRKEYPQGEGGGTAAAAANNANNPVLTSNYVKSTTSAAAAAELQKKDEMIRKLASDLRKEREESKKKDAALRKYESFYREVKARSAQKAMQRQQQQQQQQIHHNHPQQAQQTSHRQQRVGGRIGR